MIKHDQDEFTGVKPWRPEVKSTPHPRAFRYGYVLGRIVGWLIAAFAVTAAVCAQIQAASVARARRRKAYRQAHPFWFVWWLAGIAFVLIFWQWLFLLLLVVLAPFFH